MFNVRSYGAKGDGAHLDTNALQRTIDAAARTGGTVMFPPGLYRAGTLRLQSGVTLYLESGAVLLASPEVADFEPRVKLPYETFADEETSDFHHALLRAEEVERVTVMGAGMIDGNRSKRRGPKPIALKNCRHITVRDVTIQNAPNYNISLLGCEYVLIEGVTILNGYSDGIDPDCCRHVRIANCHVESWDDAIVPKASFALGRRVATENVTVTNCVLTTACNGFKLGTESSGGFKNIAVSNCVVFARPEKWKRYPTSGISLEMVDGASLERVAVANFVMSDVESPLFVRQGSRGRGQAVARPEHLEGVTIADIVATGARRASSITGIPGYPVRRIALRNLRLSSIGGGGAGLASKVVPELENEYPDADMFEELPCHGLYVRHAEDLSLDGVRLHLEHADGRPAAIFDDVAGLQMRASSGAVPAGQEPVFVLNDVREFLAQGMWAEPCTRTLFQLRGARTRDIGAIGNDFRQAEIPLQRGAEVVEAAVRTEGNLGR